MVVAHIFYFHPYLGKIPILTNIFQKQPTRYQLIYVDNDDVVVVQVYPDISIEATKMSLAWLFGLYTY